MAPPGVGRTGWLPGRKQGVGRDGCGAGPVTQACAVRGEDRWFFPRRQDLGISEKRMNHGNLGCRAAEKGRRGPRKTEKLVAKAPRENGAPGPQDFSTRGRLYGCHLSQLVHAQKSGSLGINRDNVVISKSAATWGDPRASCSIITRTAIVHPSRFPLTSISPTSRAGPASSLQSPRAQSHLLRVTAWEPA